MKNRFIHTKVQENIFCILWKEKSSTLEDNKFLRLVSSFSKEIDENNVNYIFIDATNLGILFDDKLINSLLKVLFPVISKKNKKNGTLY